MDSNRLLLIVCLMIGISEDVKMLALRCLWLGVVVLIPTWVRYSAYSVTAAHFCPT